jgi:DNA helicase-2/ATP-dependent DNA helicase PcrA
MQYSDFVSSLNDRQLEAVETDSQYTRVIAGAGSGKTRVLTYRIAYLISQIKVRPWKVLAITFTNKVANEMKNRVVKIVPDAEKDLTIKTFHSFAAYFLRQEIVNLNYPSNFTILDEEDQTKVVKDIAADHGYKKSDPIVKKTINYIGSNKLHERYPGDIKIEHERFEDEKICLEFYEEYEEIKERQYALDFDDLLLKTNIILSSFPTVRAKWQSRIDYILIDEFQDTNDTEDKMIRLLMKPTTELYVVGDPDQTIYTWRGANQGIILDMDKKFMNVNTIILDRNYRSTQNILDSANKLISNNKLRVPKNLYTDNIKGHAITVRCADSSTGEAEYVAREIKNLREINHYKYSDIAILYRSNYVTLEFEKALMAKQIPYVIYGGMKFYQRAEIKDVLAYFRLINNQKDDISFERIINTPKRGIGDLAVTKIKKGALEHNLSIYEYVCEDCALDECPPKAINVLRNLIVRINHTRDEINKDEETFSKLLEDLIADIGYYDYLLLDEDGEDRLQNVKSLFEDLRHYLKSNPDSTFDEYLQNVALVSAQDDMVEGEKITLMTVHTAKGLEYPVVFVVKLNQGVFPSNRALEEGGFVAVEEERRLAYVAFTRAKERLYLTYSHGYSYVMRGDLSESMFIAESGNSPAGAPKTRNSYKENRYNGYQYNGFNQHKNDEEIIFDDIPKAEDFSQDTTNDVDDWKVGDICIHQKFGKGVVVSLEGDGIIVVKFESEGEKTLLGNHKMISKGNK